MERRTEESMALSAKMLIMAAQDLLKFVAEHHNIKPGEAFEGPYFRALHNTTVCAAAEWGEEPSGTKAVENLMGEDFPDA